MRILKNEMHLTEKWCSICEKIKPIERFSRKYQGSKRTNYYDPRCKDCLNVIARKTYNYELARDRWLRCGYGISLEEYNNRFEAQSGVCAACGNLARSGCGPKREHAETTPLLVVDHDHKTGQVRGLLCPECNTALGMLRDDPERIESLLRYILFARDAVA